jgi:hypothetical protein
MPTVAVPDAFAAIMLQLRADSYILTLTEGRIADEVKPPWGFTAERAKYAIVVLGPRGGPGEIGLGMYDERYDIVVYGPTSRNASDFTRYVRAYLVPYDQTIANGFKQANTDVRIVREEAAPTKLRDPATRWPYLTLPLRIIYDGKPIP